MYNYPQKVFNKENNKETLHWKFELMSGFWGAIQNVVFLFL